MSWEAVESQGAVVRRFLFQDERYFQGLLREEVIKD